MLDNIIAEPIRKNLSWEWWDSNPGTLPFQDIPKVLEVTISSSYCAMLELEGRYIRPTDYFIVGIHAPRCAMGLRVLDLLRCLVTVEDCGGIDCEGVLLFRGSFLAARRFPRRIAGGHRAWPASF